MANQPASLPVPIRAAPNTPSSSFRIYDLPLELQDQVFKHLHLVIHQINLTPALIPVVGRGQAFGQLVRILTPDFFLNRKVRGRLFCAGGITGHNAEKPHLLPTQKDKDLVKSSATRFAELINLARQQKKGAVARQLEERKRDETVKYLKSAVLSSPLMRRGDLKPSPQSKAVLELETTDSRTYTQLLAPHDRLSDRRRAIINAQLRDETEEIASVHNLDVLEKLCRALLADDWEFRHVCRGCCDPELSRHTTKVKRVLNARSPEVPRLYLPFCLDCRALYIEGSMIKASSLSIFQDRRARQQMTMPNTHTSYFRPESVVNGGQVVRYYSKEEVAVLRTMLCGPDDDPSMIENPECVADDKMDQICHRFNGTRDGMEEIVLQYFRNNTPPLGISIGGQKISDLSKFGLPSRFMGLLYSELHRDVETMLFAQKAADFVSTSYDKHPDEVASDQLHWRYSVAAEFWRKHTEETFGPDDWQEMLEALNIVIVPSWELWLPVGSALRADAHFIEAATTYCRQIHHQFPADALKAKQTDAQQNMDIFKVFVAVSEAVLKSYEVPAVYMTMRVMALAGGMAVDGTAEEAFERFLDTLRSWWETFAPGRDLSGPNWSIDVAAVFWANAVHLQFSTANIGGLNLALALQLYHGIHSNNALQCERPKSRDGVPATLPDILRQAEAHGVLAWY